MVYYCRLPINLLDCYSGRQTTEHKCQSYTNWPQKYSYIILPVRASPEIWLSPKGHVGLNTHTNTRVLRPSSILFRTTRVSRHQKGKTKKVKQSGFTGARDNEWQWHQLGHMQICTLTQTHNQASISSLSFLQAGCPSCHPTNSIKALKAKER